MKIDLKATVYISNSLNLLYKIKFVLKSLEKEQTNEGKLEKIVKIEVGN